LLFGNFVLRAIVHMRPRGFNFSKSWNSENYTI